MKSVAVVTACLIGCVVFLVPSAFCTDENVPRVGIYGDGTSTLAGVVSAIRGVQVVPLKADASDAELAKLDVLLLPKGVGEGADQLAAKRAVRLVFRRCLVVSRQTKGVPQDVVVCRDEAGMVEAVRRFVAPWTQGPRWQVWANDRPLALRHITVGEKHPNRPETLREKGDWYDYGTCLVDGPTRFVVRADRDLANLAAVPAKFGIVPEKLDGRTFAFTTDKPFRLSFEIEGRVGALHLFAERSQPLPAATGAGVRRFGPGEHHPGVLWLGNGETLVLDEGAVVYGAVRIIGTNVTVCGTGILSGRDFRRHQRLDPPGQGVIGFLGVRDSQNVCMSGITIERSCSWTLVVENSSSVRLDGVKVMGSQMINDDAIDLVNSRDVLISRTFVRAQDDGLALKGMSALMPMPPVSRIVMRDCEIWTDAANPFRFGCESHASAIRDVLVENTDVLRYSPYVLPPTARWTHGVIMLQPSNDMPLENVVFRDLRIRDDGVREGRGEMYVLQAAPTLSGTFKPKTRYTTKGTIRGVKLENVTLDGVTVRGDSPRIFCETNGVADVSVDGMTIKVLQGR